MTVIRNVDGYSRCTLAVATLRIVATRSATESVSTCSSGVPGATAATASTSSWVTVLSPVMTVERAAMIGVKYSNRPNPTTTTLTNADHISTLSPRIKPRAGGFALSGDRPTTRRLASRRAFSMAVALA